MGRFSEDMDRHLSFHYTVSLLIWRNIIHFTPLLKNVRAHAHTRTLDDVCGRAFRGFNHSLDHD